MVDNHSDIQALIAEANRLREANMVDEAIKAYTRVIDEAPAYEKAYYLRAALYQQSGDPRKAIEDFSTLVKQNKRNHVAFFNRGLMHKVMGELDSAIADFSEAIRLDDGFVLAYIERGNALTDQGKYMKAIRDFNRVIEINPNDPRAYAGRARAEYLKGGSRVDLKHAQDDIQKAQQLLNQGTLADLNAVLLARISEEIKALHIEITGSEPIV